MRQDDGPGDGAAASGQRHSWAKVKPGPSFESSLPSHQLELERPTCVPVVAHNAELKPPGSPPSRRAKAAAGAKRLGPRRVFAGKGMKKMTIRELKQLRKMKSAEHRRDFAPRDQQNMFQSHDPEARTSAAMPGPSPRAFEHCCLSLDSVKDMEELLRRDRLLDPVRSGPPSSMYTSHTPSARRTRPAKHLPARAPATRCVGGGRMCCNGPLSCVRPTN